MDISVAFEYAPLIFIIGIAIAFAWNCWRMMHPKEDLTDYSTIPYEPLPEPVREPQESLKYCEYCSSANELNALRCQSCTAPFTKG